MSTQSKRKQASPSSTTSQVADSAHKIIDVAATKAEKAEAEVRERAQAVGDKAEATQEMATQKVEKMLSQTETFVREQPIAAAGLAFAVGVVATALLRR